MNKKEVKDILMSLRTNENADVVNNILGKIDLMDEETLGNIIQKIGSSKDSVKHALEEKITKTTQQSEHGSTGNYPLNKMFYYGITGDCVHIHLRQTDLHDLKSKGTDYLVNVHNMYMLDAINKLKELKLSGHPKFSSINNVYMISPIFHSPSFEKENELDFLRNFLFDVRSYSSEQLQDSNFIESNSEAQLAQSIFGNKKSVAAAILDFDTIASEHWQALKETKFQEYAKKGISIEQETIDHEEDV